MDPVPNIDDVLPVAKLMEIHRGPEETVRSRTYCLEPLQAFDPIVQARVSLLICRAGNHLRKTALNRRA
jgi:hypothetical protein